MQTNMLKRLGPAMAAVVILALTGLWSLVSSDGPASNVALVDVLQHIRTHHGMTFKITTHAEGMPTFAMEAMELKPGRMRQIMPGGAIVISDAFQGKSLSLMPATKTATLLEATAQSQAHNPQDLLEQLRNLRDGTEQDLGEQEVDGRTVVGFRVRKDGWDWTVWAHPETGLPVRVETTMQLFDGVDVVMSDFVFDVEMDESLFSLTPPEGYTLQQAQIDASEPTERELVETLRAFSDRSGGTFPPVIDLLVMAKELARYRKATKPSTVETMNEVEIVNEGMRAGKLVVKLMRGVMFVQRLPEESDWQYAGEGVTLGEADSAVFIWKPLDSEQFRVIFGDLSVRNVDAGELAEIAADLHSRRAKLGDSK